MATYWENSCSFGLRYVSWYKYLTVSLVFSHLGFWSGNLFLIAPFPDLCLLVPFFCFLTLLKIVEICNLFNSTSVVGQTSFTHHIVPQDKSAAMSNRQCTLVQNMQVSGCYNIDVVVIIRIHYKFVLYKLTKIPTNPNFHSLCIVINNNNNKKILKRIYSLILT